MNSDEILISLTIECENGRTTTTRMNKIIKFSKKFISVLSTIGFIVAICYIFITWFINSNQTTNITNTQESNITSTPVISTTTKNITETTTTEMESTTTEDPWTDIWPPKN